jgi:hypothetical protein
MFNRRSKLMKPSKSMALCLTAVSAVCVHTVGGQTNPPVAQNDAGVARNGNAHARIAHPTAPASYGIARAPAGLGARTINSAPATNGQSSINLRPAYSPFQRPLNPTLAAMSARQPRELITSNQSRGCRQGATSRRTPRPSLTLNALPALTICSGPGIF